MDQRFQQYFDQIESNYKVVLETANEIDKGFVSEEGIFSTVKDKLVSFIKTIDELIYKGISGLVNLIRRTTVVLEDAEESYKTVSPYIKRLNKYKDKLEKKLKSLSAERLVRIVKTKVPVPPGLKITIPDYINRLDKLLPVIINYDKIADMLETRLDGILESNPDDIVKYLPSKYEINTLEKDIVKYKKNFDDMFGKVMTDLKPVNKLIDKLDQTPIIVNKTLTLGKYYSIEKLQEIDERNELLTAKAKKVVELLNKQPDIASKQTLNGLANYFKLYAEYVTLIGISNIAYSQITDTIYNIVKLIVDGDIAGPYKHLEI